jgi:two-component system, OmpR family, sensor histidine kinase BaeS
MSRAVRVQNRLAWRLFLSYLVVVLVGGAVLAGTANLYAPDALERHTAHMQVHMGGGMGMGIDMEADFRDSFRAAIRDVLAVAALSATAAALVVSVFTARRIGQPVMALTDASRQVAAGDYHHRVPVDGQDELGQLGHAFNRMAEELEQTEARRIELIGNVAHELRTPLASIRSTTEGLVDGVLPADAEVFLRIQSEVARLQRLVRDLEELSRAEAHQIALEMHSTDLGDLVRTAAAHLEPQFADKGVSLEVRVAADLPRVYADAGRLMQVFTNVLGNALQYTPVGGRVAVRVAGSGRTVSVTVEDTGIGMAAEHLPHVFDRFYRVDKSRSRAGGGSGIGLTIARHLVEAHGGRIEAASPGPGHGSAFTITLPVEQ